MAAGRTQDGRRSRAASAGEPRWLNDAEQRAWRSLVFMSEWLHQGLDRQLQRDAGMPHVHYGILVSLSEAPEHTLAMSDLAGGLDHSLSRLSHAVSRLEQLGWAERRRSGSDARVTLVRLTAAGLEALRAAAPGHVAWVRSAVIDPLSPEQLAMLEEICTAVMSALAADRGDPACVDRALRRPPGTGAPI